MNEEYKIIGFAFISSGKICRIWQVLLINRGRITLSLISCIIIIKIGFSLHIIWNADISECCYFTSANNTFPNLHTSSDHSQPHTIVIIIIHSKYFWSAKIPSIIHHNQLLLTKFGKILWYVNWWHQSCSKIARLLND